MTSTWYGAASADDRLVRVNARVREIVNDLNQEHRCVVCRGIFNPLEEIGRRSCSLHPMPVQSSNVSATDYMNAQGTSRATKDHYACCGSAKVPENLLTVRDTHHDYYKANEGCTRSDHISTWGWTALLNLNRPTHQVSFESFEGGDASAHHAKHWLYVYPILFIQLLATLRQGTNILMGAKEAIGMVLGTNTLVFDDARQVLNMNAQQRRKVIQVGARTLFFDVCLAYIYMVENMKLPKDILSNEACRLIVNQQQSAHYSQPGKGPMAGLNTSKPERVDVTAEIKEQPIEFDPMILENPIIMPGAKSQSAINKAMALIGMRTNNISSARHAAASGPTCSSAAAPKQTAFQVLHSQIFAKASTSREAGTNARDDLYSLDADQLLREARNQTSNTNLMNVASGRRFDLAKFYVDYISPAFAADNDGVFFPFVVAPWMDITVIPHSREHHHHHGNDDCRMETDMTRFSPLV